MITDALRSHRQVWDGFEQGRSSLPDYRSTPTLLPSQCMNPSDRERYSRQILFPGIGERGQESLLHGHAVIAGCGALGSFHAAALARAGVGRLTLIDRDYVEPSNLHRQWLFEESDAAAAIPKAA